MEEGSWIKEYRMVMEMPARIAAKRPKMLIPPLVPAGTGFHGIRRR